MRWSTRCCLAGRCGGSHDGLGNIPDSNCWRDIRVADSALHHEERPMTYVTVIVGGILLISPEPVPAWQCEALKVENGTKLCIDKEADCGRNTPNRCKGRAE